jgi:hypothetical protein
MADPSGVGALCSTGAGYEDVLLVPFHLWHSRPGYKSTIVQDYLVQKQGADCKQTCYKY